MVDFGDVYERLRRADEHLEQVAKLANEACQVQAETALVRTSPTRTIKSGEAGDLVSIELQSSAIPKRLSVLVGDAINDLRACLDYSVALIAIRDSGHRQKGTQFPIEGSPKDFARRRVTFLRGVSEKSIEPIEALQPYNGHAWTRNLGRLSNWDKHNGLMFVVHDMAIRGRFALDKTAKESCDLSSSLIFEPTLRIAFAEGLEITSTLLEIRHGVGKFVEQLAVA